MPGNFIRPPLRFFTLIVGLFISFDAFSLNNQYDFGSGLLKDPLYLLFFLIIISLLPVIAIVITSFTKIIVVLSITRQALGLAQTPPNIVITSLAILLTCFAMYPVFEDISNNSDIPALIKQGGHEAIFSLAKIVDNPIREFLKSHTQEKNKSLFLDIINKGSKEPENVILPDDYIILAPAFLISELSSAFQIGFIIYLPFLVVDMTVANLLMALGMQMLSPTTISLPFKILLFVLVDGWRLIAEGLVNH